MTGRDRILKALAGGRPDVTPVGIDYLQLYLAERIERAYVDAYRPRLERRGKVRLDPDEDVEIRAQAILQAYAVFSEPQDWFAASPGPSPKVIRQRELVLEDGKVFEVDRKTKERRQMLLSGQETKTEEYRERFELMRRAYEERGNLDKVLADHRRRALEARSDYRLVTLLARQKGREALLYTGDGAPFWSMYSKIGFEGMMTILYDAPEMATRLMDASLEASLEDAQAYKDAGGDAIRVEECLASADIISQETYERFALPYEEKLFGQLRRMGLKVILYFCGDVVPRLEALASLPIDALIVEESKKDFHIDIGQVRGIVGAGLCLWGNLDVYNVLQLGSEGEIRREVTRQILLAGRDGAFVGGVGSPLPLDLPPQRADFFTRCVRDFV